MREWLGRRGDGAFLGLFVIWLLVGLFLGGVIATLVPAAAVSTGPSSYRVTELGKWIIVATMLAPPLVALVIRNRARAVLRQTRSLDEQGPLLARGAVNPRRFVHLFWRGGCGTLLLIFFWTAAAPFILWFYAFYVRIRNPEVTSRSWDSPWMWGGIALYLVLVLLLVGRWLGARRTVAREMRAIAVPTKPVRGAEAVILRIVGTVFFAVGLGCLWIFATHGVPLMNLRLRAWESARWPSVSTVIAWSDLVSDASGRRANIRYEYEVDGRLFASRRITPTDDDPGARFRTLTSGWQRSEAPRLVEQFPRGKRVRVFYDPADPSFAVLKPGMPITEVLSIAVILGAAGIGIAFCLGGAALFRARTEGTNASSRAPTITAES